MSVPTAGFKRLSLDGFIGEKGLERFKYFTFLANDRIQKLFVSDVFVRRHQRTAPVVLVNLPVTEHIGPFHQFFDQPHALLVI
jgi:hypothetical protein